MDLVDRQLEHEMQFPLSLTPKHDTEHLEGYNTLVTVALDAGGTQNIVLSGRVADPDRYYEVLARKLGENKILDVSLTYDEPTTTVTPAEFLSAANTQH